MIETIFYVLKTYYSKYNTPVLYFFEKTNIELTFSQLKDLSGAFKFARLNLVQFFSSKKIVFNLIPDPTKVKYSIFTILHKEFKNAKNVYIDYS